jgi:penicillin amidase
VLRAGLRMRGTNPFENVHGAAYRGTYDLADLDASRFLLAPGQSGHPLSAHYRDLVPAWLGGGHLALPPRPPAVTGRIQLRPR